jgi:hypothetical protein
MNRILRALSLFVIAVLVAGCSDESTRPQTGTVEVLVLDENDQPVADQVVELAPAGLTLSTDNEGFASFTIPCGTYFVDASLCCIGPGYFEYHEQVTVIAGGVTRVTLRACLTCV